MIYSKIETNEQGTPLKCPKCEAENLDDNFRHCPYCASFLHNVCLGKELIDRYGESYELTLSERFDQNNCTHRTLDGGFRFCPECGSETSFFNQKFLEPCVD